SSGVRGKRDAGLPASGEAGEGRALGVACDAGFIAGILVVGDGWSAFSTFRRGKVAPAGSWRGIARRRHARIACPVGAGLPAKAVRVGVDSRASPLPRVSDVEAEGGFAGKPAPTGDRRGGGRRA